MRSQQNKKQRFTWLRTQNWRNFTDMEVALQPRVFLVGPNASGKSNLLDIFRFLHDIVTIGGGFQEAVRRRGGVKSLRSLAARRNTDIIIQVHIGDDDNQAAWEYEIHFTQDNQSRPLLHQEQVKHNGELLLNRPDQYDKEDLARLTQTHLEQVSLNKEFREIAAFFEQVRYLHIVPQLIREPDRSVGKVNDPFGGDFLEQLATVPERTRSSRLRRIQEGLAVAVPQLQELHLWRDPRGMPHLRGRYEHWRPHGAWQTEEHFSDGTLRLVGLLWAVLDGNGPLLLEEPELSLHPAVIRYLPSIFARTHRRSGRQLLVSTHSADLLSDEGIGLNEVLLLEPQKEGTRVLQAAALDDIRHLVHSDIPLSDIVVSRTSPAQVEQLSLFGE